METQKENKHSDDYTLVGKVLEVIPATTLDFRRFTTEFRVEDESESGKGDVYNVFLDHYEDGLNKGDKVKFDINLRAYLQDSEDRKRYRIRNYHKVDEN